jgi:hypothetical protein
MSSAFLWQAMPGWAVGLSVTLLLVAILAPWRLIHRLGSVIRVTESDEPDLVRPAKGIVVGIFLRTALAVVILAAIAVLWLIGIGLPGWLGLACAGVFLSMMSRIRAGQSALRFFGPRVQLAEIADQIDEDVKWVSRR